MIFPKREAFIRIRRAKHPEDAAGIVRSPTGLPAHAGPPGNRPDAHSQPLDRRPASDTPENSASFEELHSCGDHGGDDAEDDECGKEA